MKHRHSHIDPNTTGRLLKNFKLAIDETKLIRNIDSLYERLRKVKYMFGQAERARLIKKEIRFLESKLTHIRKQAGVE
jgi:hypothetical protein